MSHVRHSIVSYTQYFYDTHRGHLPCRMTGAQICNHSSEDNFLEKAFGP